MKVLLPNWEEDRTLLAAELLAALPRLSTENRQIAIDYIKAVESEKDQYNSTCQSIVLQSCSNITDSSIDYDSSISLHYGQFS